MKGCLPLLTLALIPAATANAAAPATCDRSCLEGFANQYLDAMVSRNPFSLPLAPKAKFTENGQVIEVGGGLWRTASGPGSYKLFVADTKTGEVVFIGTMRENGTPIALSLRLKIENRRISEAETLVVRDASAAKAIEAMGKPDPVFLETVPPAQRRPGAELIAVAGKYDDGIEQSKSSIVPFDAACNRVQNGIRTTNNPELKLDPAATWTPLALGCGEQFDARFFSFVKSIRPRRFVAVDEERGLVVCFCMFQIPGTVKSVNIPGHGAISIPPDYLMPTTLDIAEVYKIVNGKILRLEALQNRVPYGMPSPFAEQPVTAISSSAPVKPEQSCDCACLESFVNDYLAAMVAHDPKRLPVTPDIKFSEDDVLLKLGDALWQTASGLGKYKLYFADPQAGQVAFFGTIQENGKGAALVMRLKIESQKISEVETLVIRSERTAKLLDDAGSPDPLLLAAVPPSERKSRSELIAITNQYFEAIEQGNGKVADFDPECNRFENGMKTSGTAGCSAQLDTQVFNYIRKIYPRRFLVVDEERNVVFGFFMFNHPGNILWVNSPGEGRHEMPAAATRPFSVDVAEAFRIQNGKIRKVEALMTSLPYAMKSPFTPLE